MFAGQRTNSTTRPTLVFTWGNPSRGDDAIGPEIYRLLSVKIHDEADILTDFQLQIEHAQDLLQRQQVIFVDANMTCNEPYEYTPIEPDQDISYTTHAMSPAALLAVFQSAYDSPLPEAYLLSIRGYEFNLGNPISDKAGMNMQQAIDYLESVIMSNKKSSSYLAQTRNPAV